LEPLDVSACRGSLVVDGSGKFAALATGPSGRRCADEASATLHVLDLTAWTWRPPASLPFGDDQPLRLDATDRWPIAWGADGRSLFLLASTPSERRQLWLIDASGQGQPVSTSIDFVPARLDVAPNGSAVFVLGGRSDGNSRQGAAVAGSAFVAIYDPTTLAERVSAPLSGPSLGLPHAPPGAPTPRLALP